MKILFTIAYLDGYHGSVIHVLEWAKYFIGGGQNQVVVATIFSTKEIQDLFHSFGIHIQTVTDPKILNSEYDIVFSYHFPTIGLLLSRGLKCKKLVLGSLSSYEPLESFSLYWVNASILLAMSEETRQSQSSKFNIPIDNIYVIENLVPDEFFCHEQKISIDGPKKVAVVSNHIPAEVKALGSYWKDTIKIDFIGQGGDRIQLVTPDLLCQYDLVITIGKTVQYGLALGIPVFEYDRFGGNGYIYLKNVDNERKYNFSGRPTNRKLRLEELSSEIVAGYSKAADEAEQLKEYCRSNFLLSSRLGNLLDKLKSSQDYQRICPDSFNEMSYLVFCNWTRSLKGKTFKSEEVINKLNQKLVLSERTVNQLNQKIKANEKIIKEFNSKFQPLIKNGADYQRCIKFLVLINFLRKIKHKLIDINRRAKRACAELLSPSPKLVAIIAVKNEEKYLPGFFKHLREFVDGFIVLDDCSTDKTRAIVQTEQKVLSLLENKVNVCSVGWDERGNRQKLLKEALKYGDVVLCCDADERYSNGFLKDLRKFAKEAYLNQDTAYAVHVRELWDSPDQYRSDGIWAKKQKVVLFSLKKNMTFKNTMKQQHHIQWYHDAITKRVLLEESLFHLKMINKEDREKRAALYESIDPEHKMQKIGYKYLVDDRGLEVTQIPIVDYDRNSI